MNAPLLPPALDEIRAHEEEMVAIRHQIQANPELAFEEQPPAAWWPNACSAGAGTCTAAWAAQAWWARSAPAAARSA